VRFTKAAVAVVALSLLAAACSSDKKGSGASGSGGAGGGGGGGKTGLVGVDYPRSDSDFWNSYIKYVPQMAGQLGLSIKTTNSQNDISKLQSNVQTLVSEGAKGIVIARRTVAKYREQLGILSSSKRKQVF